MPAGVQGVYSAPIAILPVAGAKGMVEKMKRFIPLLLLVFLLALPGCKPAGEGDPPAEPSVNEPQTHSVDMLTGVAFEATPINSGHTEVMSFNENATGRSGYEIDLLADTGFWSTSGDDWSENYAVVEPGGNGSMIISLLSCPDDPIGRFDLDGESALEEMLIAYIFSTDDRYAGQLKAVSDFEYILTVDHYGEREGWKAFHIEFVVPESNTRSVRCLSANDDISDSYTGISVRIDMPLDDTAAYNNYMRMLHSIRRLPQ